MGLVDALVRRAQRTPYFHLPGYMLRYWLVPPHQRNPRIVWDDAAPRFSLDGTGPLRFRDRPFAALCQRLGFDARIHVILRSDKERDPHDHPVPYLTIILRGAYWEHRYNARGHWIGVRRCGPGTILFRGAKSLHILNIETEGQPVTTLFVRCTWRILRQDWGFLVNGEKIPWREYELQQEQMTIET